MCGRRALLSSATAFGVPAYCARQCNPHTCRLHCHSYLFRRTIRELGAQTFHSRWLFLMPIRAIRLRVVSIINNRVGNPDQSAPWLITQCCYALALSSVCPQLAPLRLNLIRFLLSRLSPTSPNLAETPLKELVLWVGLNCA